jgi:hypothetical protein
MTFDRGDRTYYVSDERLRAFRALPVEERLRWVEELALFLRLAREVPVMPRETKSDNRMESDTSAPTP